MQVHVVNLPTTASMRAPTACGLIFKYCAGEEHGTKEAIVTKKSSP
jgi:hypothetical protein